MFPKLLELKEHLLIKLNKTFLILKKNPTFSFVFEQIMDARGALISPKQWLGIIELTGSPNFIANSC